MTTSTPWLGRKRVAFVPVYRTVTATARCGPGCAPPPPDGPTSRRTAVEDVHRVVYRGTDDHGHELAWFGVAPVVGRDLTALTGAPRAAGDVSGDYNAADNTQHVIYRSGDGRLHEQAVRACPDVRTGTPGAMIDATLEVERKLIADADVILRDLDAIEGVVAAAVPVEHELRALYFDTPDLALLRSGISLRRRTGGTDAGWHVKLPQVGDARLEVQHPLDGDGDSLGTARAGADLPGELRQLLHLHLRHAEVVAVAELSTRRTAHRLLDGQGDLLAEVADDRVRARTGDTETSWRELEIELAQGADESILDAAEHHLRDAGARDAPHASKLTRVLRVPLDDRGDLTSAGDVVTAYLREQVQLLVQADPAVRLGAARAVHKMRLTTRRLRSALATYRRLLDRDVTEPVRDELRWIAGLLGAARDPEVALTLLTAAIDEEPPDVVVGPVRERVTSSLEAERRDAHGRLLAAMSSPRYDALIDQLENLPQAVAAARAEDRATSAIPKEVRRAHRRMRRALREALEGSGATDEQLHEVRKAAAKRVRYAAEAAAPLGRRATRLAKRMEDAQEVLGRHQDGVVVGARLRGLADEAQAAGEPTFSYGRLHALEHQQAQDAVSTFLSMVDGGWAKRPGWLRS